MFCVVYNILKLMLMFVVYKKILTQNARSQATTIKRLRKIGVTFTGNNYIFVKVCLNFLMKNVIIYYTCHTQLAFFISNFDKQSQLNQCNCSWSTMFPDETNEWRPSLCSRCIQTHLTFILGAVNRHQLQRIIAVSMHYQLNGTYQIC